MSVVEISILSSIAMRPLLHVLDQRFQKLTGYKLAMQFMASPDVARLISRGVSFDVAISNPPIIDDLIAAEKIAPNTRLAIARSDIGVAARIGGPKIEVDTTEGFVRALYAAHSIAVSNGGVGAHFTRELARLGLSDAIGPRLKTVPALSGAEVVAGGGADFAVMATVGIPGVDGVELVGLIPQEFRPYIDFAGGNGAETKSPEAAMALMRYLASPAVTAAMGEVGLHRPS